MMLVVEKGFTKPVNLGSGAGVSVKQIVDVIVNQMKVKPKVVWDTSKPSGDKKRLMDTARAESLGFKPSVTLEKGIKEVMTWYEQHREIAGKRYNVFTEKKYV